MQRLLDSVIRRSKAIMQSIGVGCREFKKTVHFPTYFRRQYVKHVEVQRLVAASECERVHALKVRYEFATKIIS